MMKANMLAARRARAVIRAGAGAEQHHRRDRTLSPAAAGRQSSGTGRRSRRGAVEGKARAEEKYRSSSAISAWARCRQGRLCADAALLCRHRPGDGLRKPGRALHGDAAGVRLRNGDQESVFGYRSAADRHRSARRLRCRAVARRAGQYSASAPAGEGFLRSRQAALLHARRSVRFFVRKHATE